MLEKKHISNKLLNRYSDYFIAYIHLLNLLTLAKSLDGSPFIFPPSFSSAQMALPLCKNTDRGNISERFVLQIVLFVCFIMNLMRRAWQKHCQGQKLISNCLFQTGCTDGAVLWMVLSIY